MRRRDWLPAAVAAALPATAGEKGRIEVEQVRLHLRHTWTTTMSSSGHRDTVHVRLAREGFTGTGEGAPIVRYKESAQSAAQAVRAVSEFLASADWRYFDALLRQVFGRLDGQYAARAAIDIALLDWVAQKRGVPLYEFFGLDPAATPVTSFSIGIDTPEITRRKVREAGAYPILKIKVGLNTDEATLEAVRSVTQKPLRVDANEGWKSKEEAVRKINWLEKQGVEFVEQPLPASMLEEMNWVRSRVHIPVIADEACLYPRDLAKVSRYFDGVNIKLDKCGGLLEAWRMIQTAKSLGLKTMLGCMISSSVSITAAAHLSPAVDYADLDGHLLIGNDPYEGVLVRDGRLVLPGTPGLGLNKRG